MKNTKHNLIRNGFQLFLEKGYNATGIQEITDNTDVSKGSFYNHFKHKELFAQSVLEDFASTLEKEYEEILIKAPGSPLQKIRNFYEQKIDTVIHVNAYKNGCVVSNLCQEVADKSEVIAESVDQAFTVMTKAIAQCLDRAKSSNELAAEKNTTLMAEAIVNSWNGALMRVKSSRNQDAFNAFLFTLDLLLN